MRIYKKHDRSELRIKPEGWVDEIVFEKGKSSCGQAHCGMHTHINDDAGGVLTLDDMVALRDFINEHLLSISN